MNDEIRKAIDEACDVTVYDGGMYTDKVNAEDYSRIIARLTKALEVAIEQRNHFASGHEAFMPFDEAIAPFDSELIVALRQAGT